LLITGSNEACWAAVSPQIDILSLRKLDNEREIDSRHGMICVALLCVIAAGEIKEKNGVMVAARAKLLIDVLLSLIDKTGASPTREQLSTNNLPAGKLIWHMIEECDYCFCVCVCSAFTPGKSVTSNIL